MTSPTGFPPGLTALLFLCTGWLLGGNVRQGWRILRRDGGQDAQPQRRPADGGDGRAARSPLDKKGVYSLGDPLTPLDAAKVRQAWRIVVAASLAFGAPDRGDPVGGRRVDRYNNREHLC